MSGMRDKKGRIVYYLWERECGKNEGDEEFGDELSRLREEERDL